MHAFKFYLSGLNVLSTPFLTLPLLLSPPPSLHDPLLYSLPLPPPSLSPSYSLPLISQFMKEYAEGDPKLSVEERNLLSVAYKNVVGSKRYVCMHENVVGSNKNCVGSKWCENVVGSNKNVVGYVCIYTYSAQYEERELVTISVFSHFLGH